MKLKLIGLMLIVLNVQNANAQTEELAEVDAGHTASSLKRSIEIHKKRLIAENKLIDVAMRNPVPLGDIPPPNYPHIKMRNTKIIQSLELQTYYVDAIVTFAHAAMGTTGSKKLPMWDRPRRRLGEANKLIEETSVDISYEGAVKNLEPGFAIDGRSYMRVVADNHYKAAERYQSYQSGAAR